MLLLENASTLHAVITAKTRKTRKNVYSHCTNKINILPVYLFPLKKPSKMSVVIEKNW